MIATNTNKAITTEMQTFQASDISIIAPASIKVRKYDAGMAISIKTHSMTISLKPRASQRKAVKMEST